MESISFFDTYIDKTAKEQVLSVISSTFLSEGKKVKEFEIALMSELNLNNLVTVNSGTSALHLALVLAGVKAGDEVILPAQTFIASGLAVLMQKAQPVFCDINYDDGNIDIDQIENHITVNTKAIMAVHWAGLPCDMDKLQLIAEKHNLIIVEDAAHALGAHYKETPIGSISDYTCFSFQAIKHLTTGDGGAISIKDISKYEEAKRRRWFGLDRENSLVSELGERDFNVKELGYKYHLNDFAASLGLANIKTLSERLIRRQEICNFYDEEFSGNTNIRLFCKNKYGNSSSNWLYGFHVERRDDFIRHLKANGIPTSVVHQGIDKNDIFGGKQETLFNQRKFDSSQIHIPIHNSLSDEQIDYIANTIKRGW